MRSRTVFCAGMVGGWCMLRGGAPARATRAVPLLAALALGGCAAGGDSRVEGSVERDSAGIRIVETERPLWPDGRGWTVDPEPVVDIGVVDGAPEYMFDRVRAVRLLSDGRLAVADEGSSQIRIFDARGRLERAFGSRGEGPGEFSQLIGLWVTAGDTLYAQAGNVREGTLFHVFTPDGQLVRNFTMPRSWAGRDHQHPTGVLRSGVLLSRSTPQGTGERSGRWQDSTTYLRYHPDGTLRDTLVRLPIFESARQNFRSSQDVAFGPGLSVDLSGDSLVTGYQRSYELRVLHEDGSVSSIIRRPWTPVPVTEEQRSAYRDAVIGLGNEGGGPVPPRLLQQRRDMMDDLVFAEHFPAFGLMRAASDGHLWVAEVDPEELLRRRVGGTGSRRPSRWTVFDPRGRWLGTVELPAGFMPRHFGSDRIAGLWRDENEVEHVWVLGVRK